jgi:hypothetical protein
MSALLKRRRVAALQSGLGETVFYLTTKSTKHGDPQISADSDYESGKKEIRKWGRGFLRS